MATSDTVRKLDFRQSSTVAHIGVYAISNSSIVMPYTQTTDKHSGKGRVIHIFR